MILTNNGEASGIQRIGFGCSHITGGFEARSNARLLRIAFDRGVRHFDTAPLYGHGTSEEVVGAAFRGDRHKVIIATKVGIPHGDLSYGRQFFRLAASPIRRWAPRLSKFAARRIYSTLPHTDFSVSSVQQSLEKSLAKLKTDYVDILILHEVRRDDISDELLRKLQSFVQEGKIRRIGIGTSVESMQGIASAGLEFDVYQRYWSVLTVDENLFADRYQIFHGAVWGALEALTRRLNADAEARRRIQEICKLECRVPDDVAKVLLLSAVSANPRGVVLFSSRVAARVASYLNFLQRAAATVKPEVVKVVRSCLSLS
jgi:aryl-alcohol dehydrogenase-like predicted oxidoreductase